MKIKCNPKLSGKNEVMPYDKNRHDMNRKICRIILILGICLFMQTSCSGQKTNRMINEETTTDKSDTPDKTASAMNEPALKLIHTEAGIWSMKGYNNGLYYNYALTFKDNSVVFTYNTCEREYGVPWTRNIMRLGTFEVDGDILTLHFTSVQYFSDDALPEDLTVKMKMEIEESMAIVKEQRDKTFYLENPNYRPKDIEIIEYKLILKRICGKNIFENHKEDAEIELIAERPVID
ncbi:MAG: hypothetical protein FWF54_05465 [Candidatus Azobacteroides sp.]|nr:hypothetical protein [Candidatus Azobacteroides sp.]